MNEMFLNKMLNFLNFCYISSNRYCAYCVPCVTVTVSTYPWPSMYNFGLEVSPSVMRSRKAGLAFATGARKRDLCLQSYVSRITRTENFLSQQFSKFFWKLLLFMASPLQHESVRVRQCFKKHVPCLIESKKDRTWRT